MFQRTEWTGYHRIEYGLWEENTTKGYEEYAEQLMKDVQLTSCQSRNS